METLTQFSQDSLAKEHARLIGIWASLIIWAKLIDSSGEVAPSTSAPNRVAFRQTVAEAA